MENTSENILVKQHEWWKWMNFDVKLEEVKNDIIEKVKKEIFKDVTKMSNDIRDE